MHLMKVVFMFGVLNAKYLAFNTPNASALTPFPSQIFLHF